MKEVTEKQLPYLVWCAVNEQPLSADFIKMADFASLYELCAEHNITAFADRTVSASSVDDNVRKSFSVERFNAIRANMLFTEETKIILDALEKNKIDHTVLKGRVLGSCYPESYLRQMGDVDILINADDAQSVNRIMTDHGYQTESAGLFNDDVYKKPPFYKFEMHRTLFSDRKNEWHGQKTAWNEYYKNINKKLLAVEGMKYEHKFSDNDFYIYFILHAVKHIRTAGTGIRTLVDLYYYLCSHTPDFKAVENDLKALGVSGEERILRNLALKFFSPESKGSTEVLDDDEKAAFNDLLMFGAYGTRENFLEKRMHRLYGDDVTAVKKLRYAARRVFSIPEVYKERCPVLYKHRITRPLIFFVRVYNGLTTKRKRLLKEYKLIKKL